MNKDSILKNIFQNHIFPVILAVVIIFALILRTYLYKNYTAGFYCDECFLVLNIQKLNFIELFFPLIHSQCCPPLFLSLAKIMYSLKGLNEQYLRLIPYLSSMLSVLAFAFLTCLSLKNKISILFANILFALSLPLLFYTYIFKHYSFDVLASILVLITVFYMKDKKVSYKNLFFLGLIGAIMVFASYTSGFIIISSAFSLCIYKYFLSRKYHFHKTRLLIFLKSLLYFIIPFGTIMLFYLFINCIPAIQNPFLQTFWHINEPYEIFIPKSISDISHIFEFLTLGINSVNAVIITLLLIISVFYTLFKNKFFFLITITPFVVASILAVLNLYPFAPERVSLYLIPVFHLLVAEAFDCIFKNVKSAFIFLISICLIFNYNIMRGGGVFKPADYLSSLKNNMQAISITKPFIQQLYKSDYTQQDYVWGDYASFSCFEVYDTDNKINRKNIIIGWDLAKNKEYMSEIPANSNIFFYISDKNQTLAKFSQDIKILINKNCDIIYSINNHSGTMIKCKKVSK